MPKKGKAFCLFYNVFPMASWQGALVNLIKSCYKYSPSFNLPQTSWIWNQGSNLAIHILFGDEFDSPSDLEITFQPFSHLSRPFISPTNAWDPATWLSHRDLQWWWWPPWWCWWPWWWSCDGFGSDVILCPVDHIAFLVQRSFCPQKTPKTEGKNTDNLQEPAKPHHQPWKTTENLQEPPKQGPAK